MVGGESPDFAARQGRTLGVGADTASIGIMTDVGFHSQPRLFFGRRGVFSSNAAELQSMAMVPALRLDGGVEDTRRGDVFAAASTERERAQTRLDYSEFSLELWDHFIWVLGVIFSS